MVELGRVVLLYQINIILWFCLKDIHLTWYFVKFLTFI